MNIAIVIESFDPSAGGNERSTEQIARGLIGRGHRVTIVTNRRGEGAALPGGGQVIARGRGRTSKPIGLRRFASWAQGVLASGGFNVSVSMTPAVVADVFQPRGGTVRETLDRNVAMRVARLARAVKRLSLDLSMKQRLLLAMERRALGPAGAGRIVAISRYVADQLAHHYAVTPERVVTIPNAADVSPVGDAVADRRELRRAFELDEASVVYLFIAMNPPLKGFGHLVGAMRRVVAAVPGATLMVAGALPKQSLAMVTSARLDGAVRWVGPTSHVDRLYAAADVTVLPTYYDPSSKVVIESLLHGVPAITTRYNGAAAWVVDPARGEANTSPFSGEPATATEASAGRVIDRPNDVESLAGAMIELADGRARRRCGQAAQRIDPRLRMDRHVEALERVLSDESRA